MPRCVFVAGLMALTGVASTSGCGESAGSQPPVLNGGGGTGLGSSGGGGGRGSSSGSGGSSGSSSGGSSGSDGGGDGASDSGSSSGGDGGNCVSGTGCNTLQVCGAQVNAVATDAGFPSNMGGTILQGTYVLTAIDDYGSGATTWERKTIQLTTTDGGSQTFQYDEVLETGADAGSAQTFEGVLLGTTPSFTISYTCPAGPPSYSAGYTATSSTLTVTASPLVFTYTKQ